MDSVLSHTDAGHDIAADWDMSAEGLTDCTSDMMDSAVHDMYILQIDVILRVSEIVLLTSWIVSQVTQMLLMEVL